MGCKVTAAAREGFTMPGRYRFCDDVMFKNVIQNEEICKGIIEAATHRKVDKIKPPRPQAELSTSCESKDVRLDAFVVESGGTSYDVEVQVDASRYLPQRMRFYQGKIDSVALRKGDHYSELKELYIIFFCLYDPFGRGEAVYDIDRRDKQGNPAGSMDHWLVFNVMAYDRVEGDQRLRALLEYMATGRVDSPGSLQARIAAEVDNINHDEEKVMEMFTAEQTIQINASAAPSRRARTRAKQRAWQKAGPRAPSARRGCARSSSRWSATRTSPAWSPTRPSASSSSPSSGSSRIGLPWSLVFALAN